jgi:hypothetical protein
VIGKWQMADGEWQMADGEWRMADSKWHFAICILQFVMLTFVPLLFSVDVHDILQTAKIWTF